jgi:hypothetical protein
MVVLELRFGAPDSIDCPMKTIMCFLKSPKSKIVS